MGHQIIKQPDGRYAIWSSVVDSFVLVNATKQDIIDYYIVKEIEAINKEVTEKTEALDRGEKPYAQFTMTLREALDMMKEVHGELYRNGVVKKYKLQEA